MRLTWYRYLIGSYRHRSRIHKRYGYVQHSLNRCFFSFIGLAWKDTGMFVVRV